GIAWGMEEEDELDLSPSPRAKAGVAVGVIALQLVVVLGLVRAFAPDFAAKAIQSVVSTFSVTVTTPPPKPEKKASKPAGASGDAGRKAVPRAVNAPEPKIKIAKAPAPKAASTGNADTSGARSQGNGTGAGGNGNGTGNGNGGNGDGGGIAAKPSVRSGEINDSRDFPAPAGGRQARFGKSVIVFFTVTTDGRARDCSVTRSSVDAETTARVCPLVMQKIRFNPATRSDGTPVEARYGYRVDFSAR
ncbi:MAG: TonB family protein, partial [Sphingomonadales bacterium]|nr:TonB family protein [Sphingomonadales bacterium]